MLKMVFSPQFEKSSLGWTRHQSIPVHKDYALFVQFLRIGASNVNVSLGKAYIHVSYFICYDVDFQLKGSTLEIAVTGTARPLQLTIKPGTFLDFGPCAMGKILTQKLLVCICLPKVFNNY